MKVAAEEERNASGYEDEAAPADGVASKRQSPSAKPSRKRRQSKPVRHADEEVRGHERWLAMPYAAVHIHIMTIFAVHADLDINLFSDLTSQSVLSMHKLTC